MENRFLKNKIIIKYCKDYYNIINESFNENDTISGKLINIYQDYIFNIDIDVKNNLKKAIALNNALKRYFDDTEFKKILTVHMKNIKISADETNVINYVVNSIITVFNKYLEGYTRNLYIPRWI